VEQLAKVEGIGPKIAEQIYEYFHPSSDGVETAEAIAEIEATA
jgi:ERCC4-type nuclease